MRDSHVLAVSTRPDLSTDAVVRALGTAGIRCTRLNTEDLPFEAALTTLFQGGSDRAVTTFRQLEGSSVIQFQDATSIWYRRVRTPPRPTNMSPGVYDFCLRETRAALIGSLLAQEQRIMSPPLAVWAAEHKPFQLATARSCGLRIPETVITNDPDEIRRAFRRFAGRMVVKPAKSGFVDYGDEQHAVYTSQVLDEHLEHVATAQWCPSIYQPLLEKQCDVRVTVVGSRFFVADIASQTDPAARVDWRHTTNPALPHRVGTLPDAVRHGIQRLLVELGLQFGAVDLVRTVDGEYVFLEVNPNGQWLWLDDVLGLGITHEIASWLGEPPHARQ